MNRPAVSATAVAVVVLAGLAGCTLRPGDSEPPPGGWFGNPTSGPPGGLCRPPQPPMPYDPASGARPPQVPAGWHWIVLSPNVTAAHRLNPRLCVPVAVHIHATQQYNPAPLLIEVDTGVVVRLPYDGMVMTPWERSWMVFAYNPGDEDTPGPPAPPRYRLEIIATYDPDRDMTGADRPTTLRCGIRLGGGTDLVADRDDESRRGPARLVTQCRHEGDFYYVS